MVTWTNSKYCNQRKTMFQNHLSLVYGGKIDGVTAVMLRRKGKKRICKNLVLYSKGTSIRKRPKEVYKRKTFGLMFPACGGNALRVPISFGLYWELDTVVSGKTKGACFETFMCRSLRNNGSWFLLRKNNRFGSLSTVHWSLAVKCRSLKSAGEDSGF